MNKKRPKYFRQDIRKYIKNGKKCFMWGVSVKNMTRDELIGFIGYLDESFSGKFRLFMRVVDEKEPNKIWYR